MASRAAHYRAPMIDSTLHRIAIVALLTLAACSSSSDTADTTATAPDPGGWRLASGKTPTTAEFSALAASCEDKGGAIDSCLAELGLKRAQ